MTDRSVNVEMTDDERSMLVNDLVRKCDEIQARLVKEISLRKEQMDNFAHDVLKLKDEKESILEEIKQKDKFIEELKRNEHEWRNRILDYEEKFEACKQAFHYIFEDMSPIPILAPQSTPQPISNKMELYKSISELSKLVIDQTEEIRELKRVVYNIQMQEKIDKTMASNHLKTLIEQSNTDHSPQTTVLRRRWKGADGSIPCDEKRVHEEPIQPVEKKKTLQFKNVY
ncbi:unnamed protein product [Rodentolepis nana]|uniref:Coiled-coil domain-containing protein 176 n=1 Tax=Rodentolepis nana TaxID=102285 RepID=A0A0R3TBC2_RODNA|nr:unnamed protein product [Rodentolepis nana]